MRDQSQSETIRLIFEDCDLKVKSFHRVHGGDINEAWHIQSHDASYFLKVNDRKTFPAMVQQEADGLKALASNCNLYVPKVIRWGIVSNHQYLLLEWIESGSQQKDFWENFGRELALMHKKPHPDFGWHHDNYIGSLPQLNTFKISWSDFYSENRIFPLVKRLVDSGDFNNDDIRKFELACNKLNNHFPTESPSILHGDLWSGNFLISSNGHVALIDPAVYCGHREMDIGMTKLFGGFNEKFYDSYNETFSLESGWRDRLALTQLYPILVHSVLFGGHYIERARKIIGAFC